MGNDMKVKQLTLILISALFALNVNGQSPASNNDIREAPAFHISDMIPDDPECDDYADAWDHLYDLHSTQLMQILTSAPGWMQKAFGDTVIFKDQKVIPEARGYFGREYAMLFDECSYAAFFFRDTVQIQCVNYSLLQGGFTYKARNGQEMMLSFDIQPDSVVVAGRTFFFLEDNLQVMENLIPGSKRFALSYRSDIRYYHKSKDERNAPFITNSGSMQVTYSEREPSPVSTYLVAEARPVMFLDVDNTGIYTRVNCDKDLLRLFSRDQRRPLRRHITRNNLSLCNVQDISSIADYLSQQIMINDVKQENHMVYEAEGR